MPRIIDPRARGLASRSNGEFFEKLIGYSCEFYQSEGIAAIKKTPEPMHVIRRLGGGRFEAYFEKMAQPDYKGTMNGGRAICFDAKHTDADCIHQDAVTEEQRNDLEVQFLMGAHSFVLVSIGFAEYYRVPWDVWRDMKARYKHKYMSRQELEPFQVPFNGSRIDFLHGISAG